MFSAAWPKQQNETPIISELLRGQVQVSQGLARVYGKVPTTIAL